MRLIEFDNPAAFARPPGETKIVISSIYKKKQNLQSAREDFFQELARMATTPHLWILAILLTFGQHVAALCEGTGWTTLNEAISTKCYHFGGKDMDFETAETRCKGGILATYTNFAPDEPNDLTGNENCVQMLQSNGLWNDVECRKTTQKICQKPQKSDCGQPSLLRI
ncbi:hypothetical protein ScPMuIL_012143 [Solemya velum]